MVEQSLWMQKVAANPGHSAWYIERWRTKVRAGEDIFGEARFIDALAPRHARILDAGCGSGRIGGYLFSAGHTVVGVDVDPALIEAAQQDYPGPQWVVSDLAELDLPAHGIHESFDVIVSAGNVMGFLAPSTRVTTLERLAAHLNPSGRLVIGFNAAFGYPFEEFFVHIQEAKLTAELLLSAWDIRPFSEHSEFLVAILIPDSSLSLS